MGEKEIQDAVDDIERGIAGQQETFDKAMAMLREVTTERDRYRTALEKIGKLEDNAVAESGESDRYYSGRCAGYVDARLIATAALSPKCGTCGDTKEVTVDASYQDYDIGCDGQGNPEPYPVQVYKEREIPCPDCVEEER